MMMGFSTLFTPKRKVKKPLPTKHRTGIIIAPRVPGITGAPLPHPIYAFPGAHAGTIEFEEQWNTTGIGVEYDGVATDREWAELMRQSSGGVAAADAPKALHAAPIELELVPLPEVGVFEIPPTKRARYETHV